MTKIALLLYLESDRNCMILKCCDRCLIEDIEDHPRFHVLTYILWACYYCYYAVVSVLLRQNHAKANG
jgi:hypothetical protein